MRHRPYQAFSTLARRCAHGIAGYLRDAGLVNAPHRSCIRQGEAMGRPSLLTVDVPAGGGIRVSGTAVDI